MTQWELLAATRWFLGGEVVSVCGTVCVVGSRRSEDHSRPLSFLADAQQEVSKRKRRKRTGNSFEGPVSQITKGKQTPTKKCPLKDTVLDKRFYPEWLAKKPIEEYFAIPGCTLSWAPPPVIGGYGAIAQPRTAISSSGDISSERLVLTSG